MSGKRQKTQYSLALEPVARGETPVSDHQGAEPLVAKPAPEARPCRPNPIEPPWYVTRMPGGVGGVAPRGVPLSRSIGNYATFRARLVTVPPTRCRLPGMTETEPKFRVSRSAEKFEVTGRNLQLYRRLVGRTSLSLSEDKPEFSSAIGGQAVADRDNRVCVFGTTKYAQMFALTINSDHNIHDSWHMIKSTEILVDALSDPEQRRISDLQYEFSINYHRQPPCLIKEAIGA